MSYLKRYAAPRSWQILRKENAYVMRPSPGGHPAADSVPIGLLLKRLGHASTTKEVGLVMRNTKVMIDGRRIRDFHFPVGIMDTISLIDANEHYRVLIDTKARIVLEKIDANKAGSKPCRVLGKTVIKSGKLQLNVSDGRNIITDAKDIKVGDTVVISLPGQKITSALKLEKGARILLTAGRHAGTVGVVDEITSDRIRYTSGDESEQTLTDYAFVIPEGIMPVIPR